jgi:hypothetical protein
MHPRIPWERDPRKTIGKLALLTDFIVWLTESAGCALSWSKQCCYRTFDFQNKHTTFV